MPLFCNNISGFSFCSWSDSIDRLSKEYVPLKIIIISFWRWYIHHKVFQISTINQHSNWQLIVNALMIDHLNIPIICIILISIHIIHTRFNAPMISISYKCEVINTLSNIKTCVDCWADFIFLYASLIDLTRLVISKTRDPQSNGFMRIIIKAQKMEG